MTRCRMKTMFGSSLSPDVCRRAHALIMSFAYSGVCCVCFCVFGRRVYPRLPVSLDCPFGILWPLFTNGPSRLTHNYLIINYEQRPEYFGLVVIIY